MRGGREARVGDRAVPRRTVARWAVASAALAPVAMIGGWSLAAAVQPRFDPVRETISALATQAVAAPVIMTVGLGVTGACHVVTAAGLRAAAPAGRALLALGGVGTAAVAALPVDVQGRGHGIAAGVAFVALAVWPAASPRPGAGGLLAAPRARAGAAGLVALLVWFVLELQGLLPGDGALTGLSERALAGAQSLWPLAVVLSLLPPGRVPVARIPSGGD